MPDLSVVIPAYNEALRLGSSLAAIVAYLRRRGGDFEILVVDDGSRDATAQVATELAADGVRLLVLPENRGKGAALRAGVLATTGELVLLCDADLSTPIEDLERLAARLADADVAFGSRVIEGARIERHQPFYREAMGKAFNLLIRLLGFRGLHDTQCGFKLLRGPAARELFGAMRIDRFAYDVELLALARRRGLRVVEVGVTWADSTGSRVRPLRDAFGMLRDVVALRLRQLAGRRSGG